MSSVKDQVLGSKESAFYRDTVWKGERSVADPPILTREVYAGTPFLKRLYRSQGLLTKVAYHSGKPFLIGRHFDDIGTESYGAVGNRPLVAFSLVHESLEKSLWCYSKNILPLISDTDDDITAMLAKRYEADTLITDSTKLPLLLQALARHYSLSPFRYVSVVDTSFNQSLVRKLFPDAHVTFIFGLPETGGIATSCPESLTTDHLVFHPAPHRIIEVQRDLTFTDDRLLPTPLIRYRPGVPVTFIKKMCSCNAKLSLTFS